MSNRSRPVSDGDGVVCREEQRNRFHGTSEDASKIGRCTVESDGGQPRSHRDES